MHDILIGVVSAGLAALVSHPLEIFRNSWMSKNEDMKFTYTNTESRRAAALLRTMWEDGGGKIFRAGLITSLAHSAVSKGTCLGTFSLLERGGHHFKRDLGNGDGEERSLGRSGAAAAGASLAGSFAAHPLLVVRNRVVLLHDPRPRPRGVSAAPFREAAAFVYRHRGPAGFYKGALSNLPAVTLGPAVQLVTFSYAKEWLSGELGDGGPGAAVLASLLSTLALVAVVNPLDALLLKMECQGQDAPFLRGHFAAAGTLFSTDGPSGFYRGCGLLLLRELPHSLIGLVLWDYLRRRDRSAG